MMKLLKFNLKLIPYGIHILIAKMEVCAKMKLLKDIFEKN